ncbi:MAG: hypothetical protein MI924_24740 [Chloroflexales bacterium]|nr:hypothetical protein [Chloroflexales bacterium]
MVRPCGLGMFGHCCLALLNNQGTKGQLSIAPRHIRVGVGEEPGDPPLHPAAPAEMDPRMHQAHNRREAHPSAARKGALRESGPRDQIGKVRAKLEALIS